MSTIEQAAKRLQQLKESGVDFELVAPAPASAEAPKEEAVPLRVVKELEARTAPEPAPEVAPPAQAPAVHAIGGRRVEIDLRRLAATGYITPNAPRSRLAEEFRVVKRPLVLNVQGKSTPPVENANLIMVTSAVPGEGKTFTAVNLALSLAMDIDTSVLLVDADTSRPALLDRLGLPPSKGLLDLLVDPALPLDSVVLQTNVERLSVLPPGTSRPQATELLASAAMNRLVERLAEDKTRIVVFDTPPLLAAAEARVLATHMGQVVLVIAANDTPQGTVAEALAAVDSCPQVATLLNRAVQSSSSYYYGSYGSYAA